MEKIDFVLLWVDGSDPEWNRLRRSYYRDELNQNKESAYRDWGTLRYWFRGIEKFTPWVNRIHFVTCGHLPEWLNRDHPKIHIVKHEDFIPEDCLPTFSANSIELNINKIDGLEEHFVYFNDDTFVVAPMETGDFFVNGQPCDSAILSVTIPSVRNEIFTNILFNDLLFINLNFDKKSLNKNASKWFNFKYGKSVFKNLYYWPIRKYSGFENLHLPNAYLKSIWNEVWDKEPDILNETIHRRFRTKEDVNQYIFKYWQLVTGYFHPRKQTIGKCFVIGEDNKEIMRAFEKKTYKMVCLNDNPSDINYELEKDELINLFEMILPEKSGFEL